MTRENTAFGNGAHVLNFSMTLNNPEIPRYSAKACVIHHPLITLQWMAEETFPKQNISRPVNAGAYHQLIMGQACTQPIAQLVKGPTLV